MNTQLTHVSGYDAKTRMIFGEPMTGTVPSAGSAKISYKRVNISTRNEDGTVGELILPTVRLFSFGVSENKSIDTGEVNGYTFPICLYNRDGPSDEEKEWVQTFNNIVENCMDWLLDNKEDLDQFELTRGDLTKIKGGFNPLYWKREKAMENGKPVMKIVDGTGPTLYPKLIFSKKNDKFLTQFYDHLTDEPLKPMDLMGKYCYAESAIKIESIFIGARIALQIKLYETTVEIMQSGMKRLLTARPVANATVSVSNGSAHPMSFQDNDDTGSLNDDPLAKPVTRPKTLIKKDEGDDGSNEQKKPAIKRVVKKVS